jgi:recombinational DNA repair ATPase RecF
MHQIARLEIEGFWETHSIDLHLHPDVTFLIGQNGTGKTTLISLLAAALTADFRTLDRMSFKRMTITLSTKDKSDSPTITLSKTKRKERSFDFVEYKIKGLKGASELKFSLEQAEEQLVLRRLPSDPRFINDYYRRVSSGLIAALEALISVNWLSIHRTPFLERSREERSHKHSVDQKISSLSNDLVRYFSTLSSQKDHEVTSFQQSIFVSLLEEENQEGDFFDTQALNSLDTYQNALSQIFGELHVDNNTTKDLMTRLYNAPMRCDANTTVGNLERRRCSPTPLS